MFFKIKEYGDLGISYTIGGQFGTIAFLIYFIILRFTIYAFFIRVYITIKNLSLSSIIVIPKNWFKLILSTDFFHLPEILPCLESAKISHKLMTYSYLKASFVFSKKRISNKYSKFNKYIKINHKENNFQENNSLMFIINKVSNFIYIILINPFKNFFILMENIFILIGYIFTTLFDVFFEVLLLGLNFIFSFIFRYSLKSTAWIYLPLIWLIQPQNKYDLMTRMKSNRSDPYSHNII